MRTMLGKLILGVTVIAGLARGQDDPSRQELLDLVDPSGRIIDEQFAKRTGWRTLRGFELTIELENTSRPGTFSPASWDSTFRDALRFRIRVDALCDLWLYVLIHNVDGSEYVLMPETREEVPQVHKGQTIYLPNDGGAFRFAPPDKGGIKPPWTDKLRLIASPTKLPWVTCPELFKLQNGNTLTTEEQGALDQLKSIRQQQVVRINREQARSVQVKGVKAAISRAGRTRDPLVIAVEDVVKARRVAHFWREADGQTVLVHEVALTHDR